MTAGNHGLTAAASFKWMGPLVDVKDKGGWIGVVSFSDSWHKPFGIQPLTFNNRLGLVHDGGIGFAKTSSGSLFTRWDTGLNWRLAKSLSLTAPSAAVLFPLIDGGDGRNDVRTTVGSSVTVSF